MKGNDSETEIAGGTRRDDELCRLAGDLVERAVPAGRPSLSAAERERLRSALAGGALRSSSSPHRRRLLVPALVVLAVAALGGGVSVVARRGVGSRAIGFAVEGAEVDPGGRIEAAARPATVRFTDGTSVVLGAASAGRVTARTREGASFTVERGRARFEVVHRARTRWIVAAGPFEILVTGTAFDVAWVGERGGALAVDLRAGAVIVRGSLAGAGIPLRAGQRLLADLDRGALSVVDEATPAGDSGSQAGAAPTRGEDDAPPGRSPLPATGSAPASAGYDPAAHGERARPPRAMPAATDPSDPAVEASPPAAGASSGSGATRPLLEPPPARFPSPPVDVDLPGAAGLAGVKLAAGGADCLGWAPQIRFDRSVERVEVGSALSLAFSRPVIDRGRSWCGPASLRVDARFDLAGASNRLGHRPRHAGEVLVDLSAPIDLTGKTVSVHFFVEGPPDIRFAAQLFAVAESGSGDSKWVGAGFTPDLTTGRWWTLTHTFDRENRLFEGGTSPVDRVGKLTLQIYAIGKDRVWTGRVFVDDLGWQ